MIKRIILIMVLTLCLIAGMQAQKISHIETTRSWHYVYDENGKKVHTFSTTQGKVVAYSENFYIVQHGSWYYTYTARGKRLHTFAVSTVGDVLHAIGDNFTSKKGGWVYTWDKNGKKIRTQAANH